MRASTIHLFAILVLMPFILIAQDSLRYNLLWKIEGNGLQKPSYLFGTMHVNDARAFNFSDSVLLALEHCEAFALEVHPDTMMNNMFLELFNSKKGNNLMQILSDEEYLHLKEKFEKNSSLDLDQLNIQNPSMLSSMLEPDEDRPDDKETFVDAYLFGIARTLNKKVYSLETMKGHTEALSDFSKEQQRAFILELLEDDYQQNYQQMLDELVNVYQQGNILEIGDMVNVFSYVDSSLIQRNFVMANSMEKIMQKQSLFAAVGTAHLPGKDGIIDILHKRGYQVSPVLANFTGIAQNYSIDYDKMNWYTHIDSISGFAMDLPGQPTPITIYNDMNALLYVDLTNEVFFAAYNIDLRGGKTQTKEQLIANTISNYTNKSSSSILEQTKFTINNIERTNIIIQQDSTTHFRLQFIYQNDILYYFMIGNTLQQINASYADRYYKSLRFFSPAPKIVKAWITAVPSQAAFSVNLPSEPTYVNQKVPSGVNGYPYSYHNYSANDYSNMKSYLIRYYDQPTGYIRSGDKDASFNYITKNFKHQGTQIISIDTINLEGIQGRSYDLCIEQQYYVRCKVYIRGFRTYYLFHQNLTAGDSILVEDDFFKSFHFTDYETPTFNTSYAIDSSFSISTLSPVRITQDTFNSYYIHQTRYQTVNPNSGSLYILEHSLVNNYLQIHSLDSFYNEIVKNSLNYSDSIIKEQIVDIGPVKGRAIVYKEKHKDRIIREQLWLNNQQLYIARAYIDDDSIYSAHNNYFFESFKAHKTAAKFDVFRSKTQSLLSDLSSTDSIVAQQAQQALLYHPFSKKDIPGILKAINKSYADDSLSFGINPILIRELKSLADSNQVKALVDLYLKPTSTSAIQLAILETLPLIDSIKGLEFYFDLLQNHPVQVKKSANFYNIFSPLYQIHTQAIRHYPRILALAKNKDYRLYILSLSITLSASDSIFAVKLEDYLATWFPYFNVDLDAFQQKSAMNLTPSRYLINQYLNLFASIQNKHIIDSLTQDILDNQYYSTAIRTQAITKRLEVGLTPYLSTAKLHRLIHKHAVRPYLLRLLFKYGYQHLIPHQYKYAPKVAKHLFYDYIRDVDAIDFVKEIGKIKKEKALFYVYEYRFLEESESYIGVAGPFYKNKPIKQYDYRSLTYSNRVLFTKEWQQEALKLIKAYDAQN